METRFKEQLGALTNLDEGSRFVVACSGGIDSMVLLTLMQHVLGGTPSHIVVGHVNHQLRESADRDEEFVRSYCDQHNLHCHVRRVDLTEQIEERGDSPEAAARDARYQALEAVLRESESDIICTAHSRSDQAETVLMRILRGAGIKGGQSIRKKRGSILRPLLEFPRCEIERYAIDNKVPFIDDPSNQDLAIPRNWIRRKLLPLIAEEFNPAVEENLARFAAIQSEAESYISSQADSAAAEVILRDSRDEICLDITTYRKYFTTVQKAIIIHCLEQLIPTQPEMTYHSIRRAHTLLTEGRSGTQVRLPHNILLVRDRDKALFTRDDKLEGFSKPFSLDSALEIGPFRIRAEMISTGDIDSLQTTNEMVAYFDATSVEPETLYWRSWQKGDILRLPDGHTKKISDIWIDNKIPVWEKFQVPLLVKKQQILWVPGVRRSGFGWVNENTTRILKLRVEKNES